MDRNGRQSSLTYAYVHDKLQDTEVKRRDVSNYRANLQFAMLLVMLSAGPTEEFFFE